MGRWAGVEIKGTEFGLGENKYERKWRIYLERRPRTWAPQNMGAPRTQGKVVQINSRFADPAIETDKHELSLGPTRTFIVHIWRLTRILERGPKPQNGNIIVLSRSSSPDPEQYDGNRHIRM